MNTLLQRLIGLAGTQRDRKSVGYKRTHRVLTFLWLCLMLMAGLAQAGPASTEVTYYHNDLLGSPVAATNDQGELIWRKSYKPYGEEIESTADSEEEFVGYTGHRLDKETGLVYAGARHYDPVIGRFMGYDPVGFVEGSPQSFNRYAYGNNNPYKFVDPDGEFPLAPFLVAALFVADIALTANHRNEPGDDSIRPVGEAAGLGAAGPALAPLKHSKRVSNASKGGAETVQRAMSRAELEAIQNSGTLSRGGRLGDHHVSDAVNSSANRARQRLALPQTPEVRATLEVPKGVFSSPSKVKPANSMPGGGLERTAPGNLNIPAKIKRVDDL